MKHFSLRLPLLLIFMAMTLSVMAQYQDLSSLSASIDDWPSLRGCAFSERGGTVAWYGTNGYHYYGVPENVRNIIKEINAKQHYIDYISLADNGNYVIISNNGSSWHARGPQSFYDALNAVCDSEGISSATIDVNSDYFILGCNGMIRTNNDGWRSFYNSKKSTMGEGRSAWSNGNAFVVCFDKGVGFFGTVPANFYSQIQEIDFVPDFAQFGKCGNYVLATKGGRARYRVKSFNVTDSYGNIYMAPSSGNSGNTSPGYVPTPAPTLPTTYPCGVCSQTGRCLKCGGTGIGPNHAPGIIAKCGYCGGTGVCPTCHGKGYN